MPRIASLRYGSRWLSLLPLLAASGRYAANEAYGDVIGSAREEDVRAASARSFPASLVSTFCQSRRDGAAVGEHCLERQPCRENVSAGVTDAYRNPSTRRMEACQQGEPRPMLVLEDVIAQAPQQGMFPELWSGSVSARLRGIGPAASAKA